MHQTLNPFISVIIPVFNQQRQLRRCLESVLSQSFSDLEIIIVDDGSTDQTYQLAQEIANTDSRLNLRRQVNRGAGAARNTGIDLSRGQFVHFMDADDWLEQGAYDCLVECVERYSDVNLALFQYIEVDYLSAASHEIELFCLTDDESQLVELKDQNHLLLRTSVVPWNKLIRREYLNRINARFDELPYANDRTFHFHVVTSASSVLLCGGHWVRHEINRPTSLTGRRGSSRLEASLLAFEHINEVVAKFNDEIRNITFGVCMANLVWEYDRATQSQKKNLACIIWNWLQVNGLSSYVDNHINSSWYGIFRVIRSIALCETLQKKSIPVVMATNERYVPYLIVALQSISQTLQTDVECLVYVLHIGLSSDTIHHLEAGLNYRNIRLFCVDLAGNALVKDTYRRAHYSAEIYLRLWIPELFDVYPKILYLDCDLIVRHNLLELFDTDLTQHDLAGVRDFNNQQHRRYVQEDLGIDAGNYVNSGVLLFNTARLRAKNFRTHCLEVLDRFDVLSCPDQDMINIVCAGNILLVDSGWNYLWNYGFLKYREPPDGSAWFQEDFINSRSKRYIIHYSSAIKPWDNSHYEDADIFWLYAKNTSQYNKILKAAIFKKIIDSESRLEEMRSCNLVNAR
jgi:lipopolysaccharide biosynthesis glycosyltransferase